MNKLQSGLGEDVVLNVISQGKSASRFSAKFDAPMNFKDAYISIVGGSVNLAEYSVSGEETVTYVMDVSAVDAESRRLPANIVEFLPSEPERRDRPPSLSEEINALLNMG
jgi:hypothetical protein